MIQGRFSTIKIIPYGVSQGAVTSLKLYKIYTPDIPHQTIRIVRQITDS